MTRPSPGDDALTPVELNRALLSRQHLLARASLTAVQAVHHLVGLQAQNPSSPYPALWSRLAGFGPEELSEAMANRTVTRIAVMRGTIHLVTADDALLLPALIEPLLAGDLRRNATYGPPLREVDLGELAAAARDLLESEPMTPVALGNRLAQRWDTDAHALAYAARGTLPLVQVTPRGLWGRSGATTWTTTRAWLGREPVDLSDPDARLAALEEVALRYLGAFGPASVADLQAWCGLTGLGTVLERLRPGLVVFRCPPTPSGRPGRELFDLPDAHRPAAAETPPVRFLPDFDNLTLSHADRTRIVTDEHRRRLVTPNGYSPGTVLVDGMVAGTWTIERSREGTGRAATRAATLVVAPLEPSGSVREHRAAVLAEAEALVRLMADDAHVHGARLAA
ncbi:winged helix DNA-binding domain-containing protein [Cellulomonas sp. KRMCY2]|uniref:winged helix DNA-binding domain-containing protein n=1 Tax=Cellulomonas sp. KRMCY2 TaxID=1304865 RepID=UPI001E43CEC0|nr:winged helix DNA-binding domain-containing protein [Cellulomonas sp. KRMCY2]